MPTNSQLSPSLRLSSARTSRAQFSPIGHRATDNFSPRALSHRATRYPELRAGQSFVGGLAESSAPSGSLTGLVWRAGLLDRLSAPLTRYRD